jgi:hypothetical protein
MGVCPKIMKKLSKNVEDSSIYKVVPSDEGIFHVDCKGKHYMVNLKTTHVLAEGGTHDWYPL